MINDSYLNKIRERLGFVIPPTVKDICFDVTGMVYPDFSYAEIIDQAIREIFDFEFPIFDEDHKQTLESKIIKHYFFREISCESVDEWKLRLEAKMNEIMPYFNKMYESIGYLTEITDDVNYTRKIDEDTTRKGEERVTSSQTGDTTSQTSGGDTTTTESTSRGKAVGKVSDTPQGELVGLLNNTYMSAANMTDSEGEDEATVTVQRGSKNTTNQKTDGTFDTDSSGEGTRDMVEHVKGKMYGSSKAKLVMEYRKAILNIDLDIIDRLSDLFMLTYHVY